jgi:hypothetical protein
MQAMWQIMWLASLQSSLHRTLPRVFRTRELPGEEVRPRSLCQVVLGFDITMAEMLPRCTSAAERIEIQTDE